MGNWHMIAFCAKRDGLRDFALSRIMTITPALEEIKFPDQLPSIKEYTRRNFGIMQGGSAKDVCLRFSPSVAEWMKEQIWHPHQKLAFRKDGRLTLKFPVSDFREIKRKILSHGADVVVVSPKALVNDIRNEIKRMGKIYK